MSKGKGGWDNEEHRRKAKTEGDRYTQRENTRAPYDPAKEKITGLVGRIALNKNGPHIHVETTSYDGGPEMLTMRKVRSDGSVSFAVGKLWSRQAEELSALLAQGARMLAAKQAELRAGQEAAKQAERDRDLIRQVAGR